MVAQALALEAGLKALTSAANALLTPVNKAIDLTQKFLQESDKAQQASLALGKSLESVNKDLGGSLTGLRGSIDTRLTSVFAALEAGLQGTTQGLGSLINQQKITGTNYKNTAQVFTKLEFQLGASRDAQDKLGYKIIDLSQTWSISTDKLVQSLDSLAATMPVQQLAGWGEKFSSAVLDIQSQVGPGLSKEVNNFMQLITDSGQEAFSKLALLGIGDIRERLSQAKDEAQYRQILIEGIKKASSNFMVLGKGTEQFYAAAGVATETFGSAGMAAKLLADNLDTRQKQIGEVDFGKQFSTMFSEIYAPFESFIKFKIYPTLLSLSEVFFKLVQTLSGRVMNSLENQLPNIISFLVKSFKFVIDSAIMMYKHFSALSGEIKIFWALMWPLRNMIVFLWDIIKVLGKVQYQLQRALSWLVNGVAGLFSSDTKNKTNPQTELLGSIAGSLEDIGITLDMNAASNKKSADLAQAEYDKKASQFLQNSSDNLASLFDTFINQNLSKLQELQLEELQRLVTLSEQQQQQKSTSLMVAKNKNKIP